MLKQAVVSVIGTNPVAAVARRAFGRRLRIVAYHGVPDPRAFEAQLDEVVAPYHPVSGTTVSQSLDGGDPLPDGSIWLTFDDGLASVVDNALPLLRARAIPATLFVSPGLATGSRIPWWQVVRQASERGWSPTGLRAPESTADAATYLKSVPDDERRAAVAEALRVLDGTETDGERAADERRLLAWLDTGMELGNHTWDHPCLDRCAPDEQRRQIVLADRWLAERGAFRSSRLFAYPNGDWTEDAEQVIADLGYDAALLFDHRLARLDGDNRLRLSRLRLDSAASTRRARAVISGAHSALMSGG